jgi:carboxylesterase type B
MDGNIGVWDSLAAIEWTKKHISKFGGDPDNITAIGQSAGAAILTFLLLGRGGTLKLPFQQAWITSPTLPPRGNLERSRPLFNQILNFTGCSDIECMRGVSEDTFRRANINLLVESIPGAGGGSLGPGVGFTPIVDGDLIDELPIDAFTAGKFNREIERIVVGNTALEVNDFLSLINAN